VVSGLAFGCDAAAHRGCLDQGGYTAAVLPSGLDEIYPPQNRDLAARIAETGCLLSEYPPGIRPARYRFVERDRLQSGLSDLVIVVESEIHGGAMHTAQFARRQGRRLLVFSPDRLIGGELASGNQHLLATGAEAVTSVEDAIEIVRAMQPGQSGEIGTLF
jgi:DNA processing protein